MTSILIVDDEVDIRALIRVVLEVADEGLNVVGEAVDGIDALRVWQDLDGPPAPDVIVLDNRMPELTGLEVARQILEQRPQQLIVLYSAFLDDALNSEAAEVGVAATLTKNDIACLPQLIRDLVPA